MPVDSGAPWQCASAETAGDRIGRQSREVQRSLRASSGMQTSEAQRPSPGRAHIGYSLSTEEHRPKELVEYAKRAEAAGFEYASISDHFHPWVRAQGNSPF